MAAWISVVIQEIEKSKQCNGCCKGSNIDGLDMMVEAKRESYLIKRFGCINKRKSREIYTNVISVVLIQFLLRKSVY